MDKHYLKYLMYTDFYRIYRREATLKDKFKAFLNYGVEPGVRYLRVFRKLQYTIETNSIMKYYYKFRHQQLSDKYGIVMPPTVRIGKGFAIFHIKGIVLHGNTEFGDNCSILHQVTVGNSRKSKDIVAKIGNGVQLLSGCKVIGPIELEDGVTVGANAVVTHDCSENTTWGYRPNAFPLLCV